MINIRPSKLKIGEITIGRKDANQNTVGNQTGSASGLLLLWYLD
jgi:hypothetical protein